jgi:hypothetical protein
MRSVSACLNQNIFHRSMLGSRESDFEIPDGFLFAPSGSKALNRGALVRVS